MSWKGKGNGKGAPANPEALRRLEEGRGVERQMERCRQEKSTAEEWHLRSSLKHLYRSLMLEEPAFSRERNIENRLWQTVFYATVSLHRKQRKNQTEGSAKQLLRALDEGLLFYHGVLDEVQSQLRSTGHDTFALRSLLSSFQMRIGDLTRYKLAAGDAEGGEEEGTPEEWYHSALQTFPESGTPQNQLAVAAQYSGRMVEAVYRYWRALSSEIPFASAKDNLAAFFHTVQKGAVSLKSFRPSDSSKPWEAVPVNASSIERKTLSDFSLVFLRVQAVLFTKVGAEAFPHSLDLVAVYLRLIINTTAQLPIEDFYLKVAVVQISSIHHAVSFPHGYEPSAEDTQRAVAVQEMALEALFTLFAVFVEKLNEKVEPAVIAIVLWLTQNGESLETLLSVVGKAPFFSRLISITQYLEKQRGGAPDTLCSAPEELFLRGFSHIVINTAGPPPENVAQLSARRIHLISPLIKHSINCGFLRSIYGGLEMAREAELPSQRRFEVPMVKASDMVNGVVVKNTMRASVVRGGRGGGGGGKESRNGRGGGKGDVGGSRGKGKHIQLRRDEEKAADVQGAEGGTETKWEEEGSEGSEEIVLSPVQKVTFESPAEIDTEAGSVQGRGAAAEFSQTMPPLGDPASQSQGMSQITFSQIKDLLPMDLMASQSMEASPSVPASAPIAAPQPAATPAPAPARPPGGEMWLPQASQGGKPLNAKGYHKQQSRQWGAQQQQQQWGQQQQQQQQQHQHHQQMHYQQSPAAFPTGALEQQLVEEIPHVSQTSLDHLRYMQSGGGSYQQQLMQQQQQQQQHYPGLPHAPTQPWLGQAFPAMGHPTQFSGHMRPVDPQAFLSQKPGPSLGG